MAILKIVKYPAHVLSKEAAEVEKVTSEIGRLMDDMAETMYAAPGVGLAAPQVGVSKRVIVIDVGLDAGSGLMKKQLIQLANPVIIAAQGEIDWEEGCLSVPEFRINVKRKANVVVRGLNRNNKEIEIMASGLLAVAFQHEIDHLNGVLLIDRATKRQKEKYLKFVKSNL